MSTYIHAYLHIPTYSTYIREFIYIIFKYTYICMYNKKTYYNYITLHDISMRISNRVTQ